MSEIEHIDGICDICGKSCESDTYTFPVINVIGHEKCGDSCQKIYHKTLEEIEDIISDRDAAVVTGVMMAMQEGADLKTILKNLSAPDKQIQRIRNAFLYAIDKENNND